MPRCFVAALTYYKINLSPIVFRADCEVNPVAPLLISFDKQLIVIALRAVRDVQQDTLGAASQQHSNAASLGFVYSGISGIYIYYIYYIII